MKTKTIRQAEADYRDNNPLLERVYKISIFTFVFGVALVLLFDIHSADGDLSSTSVGVVDIGYAVQTISLLTFAVCALKKRRYVVGALALLDRENGRS